MTSKFAEDAVHDAMAMYWGEPCDTFDPDCPCCDAWRQYERLTDPHLKECQDIGIAVSQIASMLFEHAGCLGDFCVQTIGDTVIVFGGTNRLLLTQRGWLPDDSYCTEKFLDAIDKHTYQRLVT